MKKFIICFICLFGCGPRSEEQVRSNRENILKQEYSHISYFKDDTTGLCFAGGASHMISESTLLTNVPCTKKVEEIAIHFNSEKNSK